MYAPGDVRVEDRERPDDHRAHRRDHPLAATCICGSDLWPYRGAEPVDHAPMGHEYVGVVDEIGADVKNIKVGDFVVGSFFASDNTCEICQAGYQSHCVHRSRWAPSAPRPSTPASRSPTAPSSRRPASPTPDLIPSLLAASDVLGTGWFAAVAAEAGPGKTVAVVGDGAVGLLGILAAQAARRRADHRDVPPRRPAGARPRVRRDRHRRGARRRGRGQDQGAHRRARRALRHRGRRHPGVDDAGHPRHPRRRARRLRRRLARRLARRARSCSSPACTCTAGPPRCAGSCRS